MPWISSIQANFRGHIQFEQVQFAYPSRSTTFVLDKFQLLIKPGQRVALVGRFTFDRIC